MVSDDATQRAIDQVAHDTGMSRGDVVRLGLHQALARTLARQRLVDDAERVGADPDDRDEISRVRHHLERARAPR